MQVQTFALRLHKIANGTGGEHRTRNNTYQVLSCGMYGGVSHQGSLQNCPSGKELDYIRLYFRNVACICERERT